MSHPRIEITGNLVAQPQLRFTTTGKAVAKFSVATNHRRFNKEQEQWEDYGQPSYWDIELWDQRAENLVEAHLPKGTQVHIQGTICQERYETNGQQHQKLSVLADRLWCTPHQHLR